MLPVLGTIKLSARNFTHGALLAPEKIRVKSALEQTMKA